jgi:phage terminase large subunit
LDPPPGAIVRRVSYLDNPWFPEVLEIERAHLELTDPKAYRHVWEGLPLSTLDGAIYAAEIAEAEHDGRIGDVPRDRTRPVDTYWDLGFGDCTAIWFAQSMPDGRHRVIDYLESSGKTIEWYLIQLQQKGYLYGTDWLPHDGVDLIIHAKLGADPSRSIEILMRQAGRKVRIAPKMHVTTGINAARTLFGSCWFDRTKCTDGLQALRHYQWGPPTTSGVESRAPKHDQYSHGADAFRTMSFGAKTPLAAPVPRMQPPPQYSSGDRGWMR